MKSQYPYYGKSRHNDVIVYFTSAGTGFVVEQGDQSVIMLPGVDEKIGEWSNGWNENQAFNKIENKQSINELEKKRKLIQLTQ